jgi:hypothetical protein
MIDPTLTVRTSPISAVRWGAVLAGMAVGIALHLVLVVAGTALGLALYEPGAERAELPVAAAAWNVVAMLISAFVGGYVAARASALRRTADGTLHGAVAWGATTLVFALVTMTSLGALVGGLFGVVADHARPVIEESAEGGPLVAPPAMSATDAERAADAAAAASGWLAGAITLSLLAGLGGGALGARGARRFVHRVPVTAPEVPTQPGLHDPRPAAHVR